MNKIFTEQIIQDLPNKSLNDLEKNFLHKDHVLSRSMAVVQLGLSMQTSYPRYSQLLINEMSNDMHFEYPKLGIPSAWTLAIVLSENLKKKDYRELKNEFSKWPSEEKELLFAWLEDYPEQKNILEFGKINP